MKYLVTRLLESNAEGEYVISRCGETHVLMKKEMIILYETHNIIFIQWHSGGAAIRQAADMLGV
jgi:hypothetical protein